MPAIVARIARGVDGSTWFRGGLPRIIDYPAICADSGMRHYVRKTADGIELRSRFYDGYVRRNGMFVRGGPAALLGIESALNHHMLEEFTNLAHVLPAVYAEATVKCRLRDKPPCYPRARACA